MSEYSLCRAIIAASYIWGICFASKGLAQIVPDASLGVENSILTEDATINQNQTVDLIEGGAQRGTNLFHSFEEFNITEQQQLYFASPQGTNDIFTRVTGANTSEILGTLGVDGSANLFLLNPNGILFGQNSQLNISGSFLGTTAESYVFDNDENFSSTNPDVPALLTINFPIGLQFGSNPGDIVNRAQKPATTFVELPAISLPEGLRINPGEKLSLLGGEILVDGGYFNTAEGNIELGAVSANNFLGLTKDGNSWQTSYTEVGSYENIQFQQQAGIDGGNLGGAQIDLRGKNISFGYSLESLESSNLELEDFYSLDPLTALGELPPDPSRIVAQNSDGSASAINLIASDTFSIIDPGLTQQNLIFNTFGSGNAGIVNINASDIILYGAGIESSTFPGAAGNSGSLNFQANNMSLQNSFGAIDTFSSGRGGSITVDLTEDFKIKNGGFTSKVESTGNGGLVEINSQNLEIVDGGFGVNTFGSGNGGSIDLNIANKITVNSGGFGADAFDQGDGGTIEIDAQNIEINDGGIGVNNDATGKGGTLKINTEVISLTNSAISAESGPSLDEEIINNEINIGSGGNIFVNTNDLILKNSRIATLGGTILINVDQLKLLNDSETVVFINDQSDLENAFGADRAADTQDFIVDNQDSEIVTSQSDTGQRTLILENEGKITADNSEQELTGIAIVAANTIELSNSSEAETPEAETPEVETPEVETPEVETPEVETPEVETPEAETPEVETPEVETPEAETPEVETPEVETPEAETPEVETPEVETLEAEAPEVTNPEPELFEFGSPEIASPIPEPSDSESLVSNPQLLSALDLYNIVESEGLSNSDNSSETKELIEMLINGIFISKSSDSKFDLSSACRIGSNFVSVGKGGVTENIFHSVTPDVNIADFGINSFNPEFDEKRINSLSFSMINKSLVYIDEVIEAQNWQTNSNGRVELVAASEQIDNKSINYLPNCLKSYFIRHQNK